jgi:hypothetical protein
MAERVGFGHNVYQMSTSPNHARYPACFQYRISIFTETRIQKG